MARAYGIEYRHLPVDPKAKDVQQKQMLSLLQESKADLVVLARYMQVLGLELCEAYARRMINIHHSFLPAFVGGKPRRGRPPCGRYVADAIICQLRGACVCAGYPPW